MNSIRSPCWLGTALSPPLLPARAAPASPSPPAPPPLPQYGTVPLVASTGGLVDTVKEGVTGFQMGAMDPDRLTDADAGALGSAVRCA